MARRSKDWQDRRCKRKPDDTEALARIHTVIGDLPTYGYRRVWALLRRQSETADMAMINAKRVYRIMRQNALLLERKPAIPPSKRAHTGKVAVGERFAFCSHDKTFPETAGLRPLQALWQRTFKPPVLQDQRKIIFPNEFI